MSDASVSKAAFVALAGASNVGKSTLLNRILRQGLAIASPKPQTTRTRLLGIHTEESTQLVFIDTPGIHRGHRGLGARMMREAREGVREADIVCWVFDAERGIGRIDEIETQQLAGRDVLAVLNKIDRKPKKQLLPILARIASLLPEAECVPVSATTGENVADLVRTLVRMAPEGPWLYDADTLTDQPERVLVGEYVREQLFLQLREELPYRVAVTVDGFEEGPGGKRHISATIYTDTASSKAIIVGAGGKRIKEIGIAARRRAESVVGGHIYLELFVKVRQDWQDDARFLDELGL
jgi:GTP-binding protein Era